VLARSANASDLAGRELTDAWDRAIEATGLPLYRATPGGRARVAWGAPLPSRMAAERELAEIVLTEMLPIWRVREVLLRCLPIGWSLVDLHDAWLGAPALAGRVTGAVYRVTLAGAADGRALASAADRLLGARQLIRERLKGGVPVPFDLRPLLAGIELVEPGPPTAVRIEVRIHPERGSGRPEEVVAALADDLGSELTCTQVVRERLIIADASG
jgi:hypothetical protein